MPLDALPRVPPDVTDAEASALLAICGTRFAIADSAGLGWCRDAIEALTERGYLVSWTPPRTRQVLVTLTPYAADALKLDLDDIGLDEHPEWVPDIPLKDRPPFRVVRLPRHMMERLPRPELVAAPFGDDMAFAWAEVVPVPPVEIMRTLSRRIREGRRSKKRGKKRRQDAAAARA